MTADIGYIIEFACSETSQDIGQFRRVQGSEIIFTSEDEGVHVYLMKFQRPSTERSAYRQNYEKQFYNYIRNWFESSIVIANSSND
jgi:hypothetical protein